VPYRDREEHLDNFLPQIHDHLKDAGLSFHIVIAEQEDGLAFNRGAMKNAGFLLGGASDYTCFHDVDYLPLNADYGWTDDPACLVLTGNQDLGVKKTGPVQPIHLDMKNFFGGVVMVPDALFRQVDGYSNGYWGWGYEDTDLLGRFEAAGIAWVRRPGTFCPLLHDSHGYEEDGGLNPDAATNRARYMRKWRDGRPEKPDGLSTLAQEILSRETLIEAGPDENGGCEKITVRLFRPDAAS
jgi:hypothetical protein